jgi:hypothetical protein
MTRNKTRALWLAAAFLLSSAAFAGFTPLAEAQGVAASTPETGTIIKTRFEVLHMLYQSLQVRSLTDMREIHTFTYAPEIRDQMQKLHDSGGYQYGDKVVVWYHQGADVALKIKGKPSKPH